MDHHGKGGHEEQAGRKAVVKWEREGGLERPYVTPGGGEMHTRGLVGEGWGKVKLFRPS